jgi:hypothetical protein
MLKRTLLSLARARFMAIISTILLTIIIGGLIAACASNNSSNTTNNSSGSTATTAPTKSVPAGFTMYDGGAGIFTIFYPSDWKVGDGEINQDFTGPAGQIFSVDITLIGTASPGDAAAANTQVCQNVAASNGISAGTPTPGKVTINGQQWQQLDCGVTGNVHYVVESLVSKRGDIYTLSYGSPAATFASDRTQFFSVMEQSFTYL